MNKQEAIGKIKNIDTLNINDIIAGQSVDMVIKNQVIDLISQIDEPQKVVVPKLVAEWYEKNNDDLNTAICGAIIGAYRKVNGENDDFLDTFEEWVVYEDNSILIFVQMKLFGYEIEQEKLYTVQIPNPNSYCSYTFLSRNDNGVCLDASNDAKWKQKKKNQFTEAEIRKDFEWAWQWAKEVE